MAILNILRTPSSQFFGQGYLLKCYSPVKIGRPLINKKNEVLDQIGEVNDLV